MDTMDDTKCPHHSEPFQMYCKTCPKRVCLTCITGNLHLGHEFEKLDTVAEIKRRELEEYTAKELPGRKQALSSKMETIRDLRKKNADLTDASKSRIEKRKQSVIEHFDREFQHLLNDLDERSKENDKVLTELEQFSRESMNELEELEKFCKNGIDTRSSIEIMRKHEDIDKVNSELSSIDIPKMEFFTFKESQEILPDKIKIFGTICKEAEASLSVQVATECRDAPALTFPEVFDKTVTEIIEVEQKSGTWLFEDTHRVVSSLCAGSDGEIWVSCQASRKISQLDSSGKNVRTINPNSAINAMVLANDQKKLLILSTKRVRQLQLDTEICSVFIQPPNLYPTAICTTDQEEVLLCVVDSFNRANDVKSTRLMQIYSDKGQLIDSLDKIDGKSFGLPKHVTYNNADDTICVFDAHYDKLVVFDREANLKYRYKAKNVVAICYEPHGYLVVAKQESTTICFLDQRGHLVSEVATPWGISPRSMALDAYGQILIGTSDGKIIKLHYNYG
ncbi:hypothetical protein FSP39_024438 [Pinctada imbricata]|uniref:B box-type domain-containing protein n=1 Tax=Pinctada imbricata TaxID=66713 RepID=A0AA89CBN2_PINIB|nr:hypothetical protein FSP39_024438 [Pinctada imbricata]